MVIRMNDYIEISTRQLNDDRQTVQTNIENISNTLGKLANEINKLNGMWSGPANMAYNQQTGKDFEKIGELMKTITSFAQKMEFAAQEYTKCEIGVAELVAAIRV